MDWLWRGVTGEPDLAYWEQQPFSADVENGPCPHDKLDNHEREVGREQSGLPEANGIARQVARAILRFDVFPTNMLRGVLRRFPVEVGDTVGLRYHFVPGVDLFFAARVIDRFEGATNGQWRCGFTYRTLQGHPECGEETLVVEKDLTTGIVTAALRSWSRPGLWIAKLMHPVVRRLQLRAGRAALDHLESSARPIETTPAMAPTRSLVVRRNLRTNLLQRDGLWRN